MGACKCCVLLSLFIVIGAGIAGFIFRDLIVHEINTRFSPGSESSDDGSGFDELPPRYFEEESTSTTIIEVVKVTTTATTTTTSTTTIAPPTTTTTTVTPTEKSTKAIDIDVGSGDREYGSGTKLKNTDDEDYADGSGDDQ